MAGYRELALITPLISETTADLDEQLLNQRELILEIDFFFTNTKYRVYLKKKKLQNSVVFSRRKN